MNIKLAKIVLAVLGFAIIIFLSCSDYQSLKFPDRSVACGNRTQPYDEDKYECRASTNPNGIYLKAGITDSRDGKHYDAVLIGEQVWMAQNLNYSIPPSSRCYEATDNGDNAYCNKYGRLYDWVTAMNIAPKYNSDTYTTFGQHTGICPTDWHIPNDAEWTALINFVGDNAGTKLKFARSWFEDEDGISGADDYGFAALPGGIWNSDNEGDNFLADGLIGMWWSTENSGNVADNHFMAYNDEEVYAGNKYKDKALLSVRCVKD